MSSVSDFYREQIATAEAMLRGRAGWDRSEYGDGQFESGFFGSNAFGERWAAWHGLGTYLEGQEVATTEQALELAGLNWDVAKVPVFGQMPAAEPADADPDVNVKGPIWLPDPRFQMTVRVSDNQPLGVVGKDYKLVQNRAAFDFANYLLDSGEANCHGAMSLKTGRCVVLVFKLTKAIRIAGLEDETIQMYLVVKNGHDGRHSFQVCITPVRVVCWNTTSLALKGNPRKFTIVHTSSIDGKIAQARKALGVSVGYAGELEKAAAALVSQKLRGSDLSAFLNRLVPLTPAMRQEPTSKAAKGRDRKIGDIRGLIENSPNLENVRGTRWAALQGTIEYQDWMRPLRTTEVSNRGENLVTRSLDEDALKDRAFALLS